MSSEFLVSQAAIWLVIIVGCLFWMKRSDNEWRTRLRAFDQARDSWHLGFEARLAAMDQKSAERREESARRLDQLISVGESLGNTTNIGESDDEANDNVLILVSLPGDTPPNDVSTVIQKVRTAVEEARTATGGRGAIHVESPANLPSV